ncbi:MAG: efflux RND transporter periplasmic adaptor subunit, partial [Desulfuromonadales bacterium]
SPGISPLFPCGAWKANNMKRILTTVALAASLLVTPWQLPAETKASDSGQEKPKGLLVETAQVRSEPLVREITATGTTLANESVVLATEIAGRVSAISLAEGQAVAAGDVLLKLDPSILVAERDRAEASFNLSAANIKRAEQLLQEEAISARERDEAYAQWRLDQANLRLAEAQLAKTVIQAPFSGLLGLRRVSIGEYLQPGETIATLDDIDPIKVDFRIPEVFAHQLRVGQKIRLQVDAVPDQTFVGEVYAIDPQVDVNGRSILLRAKVAQDKGPLRPGMFARVALVLEERPKALMIPEEAIIPGADRQQVFKVVDGKVVAAVVETGLRTKGKIEITSGLAPGDTIITAGQIKVRPGMPVTEQPAAPAADGTAQ